MKVFNSEALQTLDSQICCGTLSIIQRMISCAEVILSSDAFSFFFFYIIFHPCKATIKLLLLTCLHLYEAFHLRII